MIVKYPEAGIVFQENCIYFYIQKQSPTLPSKDYTIPIPLCNPYNV